MMWKHLAPPRCLVRNGTILHNGSNIQSTCFFSARKSFLGCMQFSTTMSRLECGNSLTGLLYDQPFFIFPRLSIMASSKLSSSQRSLPPGLNYIRWFCSTTGGLDEDGKKQKSQPASEMESEQMVTNPVFAEYLAGKGDFLSSSGKNNIAELPPKRRRRKKTIVVFEDEKELYRSIHRNQILQKEKSRKKTSANVYRALLGNVVICFGECTLWHRTNPLTLHLFIR